MESPLIAEALSPLSPVPHHIYLPFISPNNPINIPTRVTCPIHFVKPIKQITHPSLSLPHTSQNLNHVSPPLKPPFPTLHRRKPPFTSLALPRIRRSQLPFPWPNPLLPLYTLLHYTSCYSSLTLRALVFPFPTCPPRALPSRASRAVVTCCCLSWVRSCSDQIYADNSSSKIDGWEGR